jgi:hypothetical protein
MGEIEIPTHFVWGTLRDGSSISAITHNEFSIRVIAINMTLTAAGPPGL